MSDAVEHALVALAGGLQPDQQAAAHQDEGVQLGVQVGRVAHCLHQLLVPVRGRLPQSTAQLRAQILQHGTIKHQHPHAKILPLFKANIVLRNDIFQFLSGLS